MIKFVPKFGVRPIIDFEVFEVATFTSSEIFFASDIIRVKKKSLIIFRPKKIIYEQEFSPKRILTRVEKTKEFFSLVFVVI